MKILVTGFDPFGGEAVNPAWEAVSRLPEIGGKEAFYWETLLPRPMAEKLAETLARPGTLAAPKAEALKRRAARFDWDTCTEQYIRYYLEILGS